MSHTFGAATRRDTSLGGMGAAFGRVSEKGSTLAPRGGTSIALGALVTAPPRGRSGPPIVSASLRPSRKNASQASSSRTESAVAFGGRGSVRAPPRRPAHPGPTRAPGRSGVSPRREPVPS